MKHFQFSFSSIVPAALILICATFTGFSAESTKEKVGRTPDGRVVVPVNQVLTPAGRQVELPGLRPQVIALSPDGKLLATSGKMHELILIDPPTGKILDRVPLPGAPVTNDPVSSHLLQPDKDAQVSFTGLIFSADGKRIFLSNVNGSVKVFSVGPDQKVVGIGSFSLPEADAPRRKKEIPAGLALSPDGKILYVTLNLSNQLLEMDSESGKELRLTRWCW